MRPSAAGPMLPSVQTSSLGSLLLKCQTLPTEITFLAHACGRAFCVPVLLMLCVVARSKSNSASSSSCDSAVYCVVCVEPQLAVCCIACQGSAGLTLSR